MKKLTTESIIIWTRLLPKAEPSTSKFTYPTCDKESASKYPLWKPCLASRDINHIYRGINNRFLNITNLLNYSISIIISFTYSRMLETAVTHPSEYPSLISRLVPVATRHRLPVLGQIGGQLDLCLFCFFHFLSKVFHKRLGIPTPVYSLQSFGGEVFERTRCEPAVHKPARRKQPLTCLPLRFYVFGVFLVPHFGHTHVDFRYNQ